MNKYLVVLVSFFIVNTVNAQNNFQGEITYRLHASNEEKKDAELKILFGINKLKLRFKEKEDYDKEDLIVLFDSAAMFVINKEAKTYTKKTLHVNPPSKQFQKRSFSGYSATPVSQENNGLGSLLGELAGSTVIFYVADSLYYHIPPVFSNNKELIVVQKNKIVLAAEININDRNNETQGEPDKPVTVVTIEAIEIKPMQISEDEFSIPADYVDRKSISYEDLTDSTVTVPMPDTVIVAPPPKKTVSKKPVKSAKPKPAVKSPAVKRKE